MRTLPRLVASAAVVAALVLPLAGPPAGAAPALDARATDEVEAAVAWLATQQQADGGFEVAQFPGFETPDAVLALAAAGQSGPGWDTEEALAAVTAVTTEGGLDGLDALDDWVDEVQGDPEEEPAAKAQQAAKVVALVTEPLGLDATAFDPSDDSPEPVDLVAAVEAGAGPDGDYADLPLTGQAYALWALAALGAEVPEALVAALREAQAANGSWNFMGDPSVPGFDVDATAIAVIALAVSGIPHDDDALRRAAVGLGRAQTWTGDWAGTFDDGNPNSTAVAALVAATLGSSPDRPCWRDRADTRFHGLRYPSPSAALVARQVPEGYISGPNDAWGLNTFGTSQAVQALVAAQGSWPYAAEDGCTTTSPGNARRLVNAIYLDVLGRFSDEGGAAYWVGRIEGGTAPGHLSRLFSGTPEYQGAAVDAAYRRYLDRPSTQAERDAGAGQVRVGRRFDAVATVLGSQEYYEAAAAPSAPSAEAFVEALFLDVVRRPADPAGRQWFLDQLAAGRSRTQVARTLLGSGEALAAFVDDLYNDLLRRRSDAGGRAFWVDLLTRGRSPEELVVLISGSPEYEAATRLPA